ncbi:hypothetical protein V5N11_010419 [Cardamine amara subsp. amara]|uniref:Retrotransposon gag domain-containing protein n=1 Tax=Cardamine amara subsp. amara TaxID=228776 RepID=A0ABD0ZJ55_CARAN
MDHIEKFEDLVTSIKANGVSYDYLYCKLFPYSLGGEAAYWLKQLKPGSLTTWDDTKNAFLSNFYDDARSEELRMKISTFSQGPTEAFKTAWARFRAYQRDCPHHGFSEVQLLGIFFRGIDWRYQMALDATSNINFNTRYPEDAVVLIENLASSNSTKNVDFERKKQAGNLEGNHIAEVKAKLDTMHNLMMGKKQVQFVVKVEVFEPDNEQEEQDVNYVSGIGFQHFGNSQGNRSYNGGSPRGNSSGNPSSSNYRGNQTSQYQKPFQSGSSFTKNYGSSSYQNIPPPTPTSKMESMLEKLLEGQQKITVDFNGKLDSLYTDLYGKIEQLNIHVKKLDTQVAQTARAVKRQDGFLPGKMDTNPRHSVNAIALRSGKRLEPVIRSGLTTEEIVDLQEIDDDDVEIPEEVSIDTTHPCRSTPVAIDVTEKEKQVSTDSAAKDSTPLISVDRHQPSVDRHPSRTDMATTQISEPVTGSTYKPRINL